jgi:hypothetical protein
MSISPALISRFSICTQASSSSFVKNAQQINADETTRWSGR